MEIIYDLQRFGGGSVVNTTTGTVNAYTGAAAPSEAMSAAMKVFYDTELLENAREEAVYGQLGKPQVLPAGHGKTVEWRKWNTLPEPDKLTEGVIPDGKKFGQSALNVTVAQYGEYVTVSDQLQLHAVDDTILGAAEEVGAAMGRKADRLTRDAILAGSTNVLFAPALDGSGAVLQQPTSLYEITADADSFCRFTPDLVARAVTRLKKQNAPTIDGKYVAVVHPSVAYDLRNDPAWINYHQYDAATEIFTGEIGELHGVRFIESNAAPVLVGQSLFHDAQRYLTITARQAVETPGQTLPYGVTGQGSVTVTEAIGSADCTTDWAAMVGQYVLLCDADAKGFLTTCDRTRVTGVDPESQTIHLAEDFGQMPASGTAYLMPGNGGQETQTSGPVAVYATMLFGRDAFGVVSPEGAGMELIIKTGDRSGGPLNQFSTVGGKMSHGARVLYPERMITIYSASSYSADDEGNWAM